MCPKIFRLSYLNKGRSPSTGDSVVPEQWVDAALAADSPHLMPGRANTMSDYPR